MNSGQYAKNDPRHHTANIKNMLNDVTNHLRADVKKVNEPRTQALFETTAEVLQGLGNAYDHFEKKSEEAWK